VAATVDGVRVVSTHLGAGVGDDERARQAELVAAMAPGGVVAGDLNTAPGSIVLARFAEAGFRDAWALLRPDEPGATNWLRGPRDEPPTQRLDYVLVGGGLTVVDVSLPDDPVELGRLSDHLPLNATLRSSAIHRRLRALGGRDRR
jgi:endonuclease/exonuclease/phosphatase family metal-dependent hydrolase